MDGVRSGESDPLVILILVHRENVAVGSESKADMGRIYVVTEYVIYPKKGRKSKSALPKPLSTPSPPSEAVVPTITAAPSRTDTPEPTSSNGTAKAGSSETVKSATYRARQPRADGGVVCSLAVNEYCFKIGRVTVPPVSPSPIFKLHFDITHGANLSSENRSVVRYAIAKTGGPR